MDVCRVFHHRMYRIKDTFFVADFKVMPTICFRMFMGIFPKIGQELKTPKNQEAIRSPEEERKKRGGKPSIIMKEIT